MSAKTPSALWRARVATGALSADPAQAQALPSLDALHQRLSRWRPEAPLSGLFGRPAAPLGLYLHGPVGRGKSLLMDLVFEAAPIRAKRRVHFHTFMQERHAFLKTARARSETGQDGLIQAAAQQVAGEARFLCFDELQVSDIADAMILGRLFEALFAEGVALAATSNRPPDDLYKNGLNRQLFLPFIALLKARMAVVEIAGAKDHRLERLLEAPLYHTPLGPLAEHAMDRAWERLTMGAQAMPQTLDVQGRRLTLARTAAGVARAGFAELCEAALGPADYLAIAERFHTLILEGVPLMGPDRRESAARFRILIDALYEAKTKLVLSAAAEPAALYPEGAQSFEFQRAASRLMEMRSKDYLALARRDADFMRGVIE